ncbi:hypothetical protein ES711_09195 [Gelidibacter salicanalis]|uniref:Uncharacterized protein n=1 Tax=Gelidibacter salicanalis TaxID=291193 RepID=A0A5C7AS26_9FLAO|nr:hypothetical protein [Gelidibacter salicanalis]TXE08662.1 hypothetical protein ES711_09195 [Gelidibacter salicanalis]
MYNCITEEERLRHSYYQIMELSSDELHIKLNSWSREDLIEWLVWNDRNGVYRDEESLSEMGNILEKDEAISIITRQILV